MSGPGLELIVRCASGRTYRVGNIVVDEEVLTGFEIRFRDEPLVALPFAVHGSGYHTICRRSGPDGCTCGEPADDIIDTLPIGPGDDEP